MGRSGIANSLHTVKAQELVPGSPAVASNWAITLKTRQALSQTWNNLETETRGRHTRRRGRGVSLVIV